MKKTYVSPLLEIIEAKGLEAVMESASFIGEISGSDVLGNSAFFADKKDKPVQEEEEEDEEENNNLWGGSIMGNIDLWD